MFNCGGELELRQAFTAEEAKEQLLDMISNLPHLDDGDRFEVEQVEQQG
jgi:hypothetical protein